MAFSPLIGPLRLHCCPFVCFRDFLFALISSPSFLSFSQHCSSLLLFPVVYSQAPVTANMPPKRLLKDSKNIKNDSDNYDHTLDVASEEDEDFPQVITKFEFRAKPEYKPLLDKIAKLVAEYCNGSVYKTSPSKFDRAAHNFITTISNVYGLDKASVESLGEVDSDNIHRDEVTKCFEERDDPWQAMTVSWRREERIDSEKKLRVVLIAMQRPKWVQATVLRFRTPRGKHRFAQAVYDTCLHLEDVNRAVRTTAGALPITPEATPPYSASNKTEAMHDGGIPAHQTSKKRAPNKKTAGASKSEPNARLRTAYGLGQYPERYLGYAIPRPASPSPEPQHLGSIPENGATSKRKRELNTPDESSDSEYKPLIAAWRTTKSTKRARINTENDAPRDSQKPKPLEFKRKKPTVKASRCTKSNAKTRTPTTPKRTPMKRKTTAAKPAPDTDDEMPMAQVHDRYKPVPDAVDPTPDSDDDVPMAQVHNRYKMAITPAPSAPDTDDELSLLQVHDHYKHMAYATTANSSPPPSCTSPYTPMTPTNTSKSATQIIAEDLIKAYIDHRDTLENAAERAQNHTDEVASCESDESMQVGDTAPCNVDAASEPLVMAESVHVVAPPTPPKPSDPEVAWLAHRTSHLCVGAGVFAFGAAGWFATHWS